VVNPVELHDLLAAVLAGALTVMAGALYALLFAWSRVYRNPRLLPAAYGAYAVLAASVGVLATTLHLDGFWWLVTLMMLVGYGLAPHGIWHLCVATHAASAAPIPPAPPTSASIGAHAHDDNSLVG
jgi:hypothetical protein